MICFILYLIEGIGLAVSGNLVKEGSNNDFVISSVIAFLIDFILIDSLVAIIASKTEKRKQSIAYFFRLRGYYDIFASVYKKVKMSESNI